MAGLRKGNMISTVPADPPGMATKCAGGNRTGTIRHQYITELQAICAWRRPSCPIGDALPYRRYFTELPSLTSRGIARGRLSLQIAERRTMSPLLPWRRVARIPGASMCSAHNAPNNQFRQPPLVIKGRCGEFLGIRITGGHLRSIPFCCEIR